MTHATTATSDIFSKVWHHLDEIYPDDGDLLTGANDYIESVRAELLCGRTIDSAALARLLERASRDVRSARHHLGHAVQELGAQGYGIAG